MAVSCPEVMYGAYYPYLYGRAGPSRPFYQYERFNQDLYSSSGVPLAASSSTSAGSHSPCSPLLPPSLPSNVAAAAAAAQSSSALTSSATVTSVNQTAIPTIPLGALQRHITKEEDISTARSDTEGTISGAHNDSSCSSGPDSPHNLNQQQTDASGLAAAAAAAAAAGSSNAGSGTYDPTRHGSLTIEWQTSRNNPFVDPIEYILQMAKARDQEFQQAYRGPETRFTVQNLQHGVSYAFKVCPVRVRQNGEHVNGSFSPVMNHHLAANVPRTSANATRSGHGTDDVDGRAMFQGNVVNSRGELVLTKASAGAGLLLSGTNGYGPDADGHHHGSRSDSVASTTLQQLQQFFEPDSSKAVVCVVVFFLLSIIVAAFLK